jgi:hypothetical protein
MNRPLRSRRAPMPPKIMATATIAEARMAPSKNPKMQTLARPSRTISAPYPLADEWTFSCSIGSSASLTTILRFCVRKR